MPKFEKYDCAKIVGCTETTDVNGKYCMISSDYIEITLPSEATGESIEVKGYGVTILPDAKRTGYVNEKNLQKADCRSVAIHLTGKETFDFLEE